MSQCRSCDFRNPAGVDRCQNCGASVTEEGDSPARDAAPTRQTDAGFEKELLSLLEQGKKIEAIKRYREQMGVGLKDAKDAVEALAAKHHIQIKGAGCAGVVALILAVGLSVSALAW